MISSASILPVTGRIAWRDARPSGPDGLTAVSLTSGIDVLSYRQRDQELAYRDLVIAALLSQVALKVSDVWQFAPSRLQLPATVNGTLLTTPADIESPGPLPPGTVAQVKNSSVPLDAIDADKGLFNRDLVLHEALYRAAQVLIDNPVSQLSPDMPAGDAWSVAEGAYNQLASVGFNLPLDVALFKRPDTNLAARDNELAAFIAQMQEVLSDVFAHAQRLYVKVPGAEPETYVLLTDTDEQRVWGAFPHLPDGRLQIVYNKAAKTVAWLAEDPIASNPAAQALSVPVTTGNLDVIAMTPPRPDSDFFRQKAARIATRPYTDRLIFQSSAPQLFLTAGGIYQPEAVLIPINGGVTFSFPVIVPPGCVRLGILVMPSRFTHILGFLNVDRVADGTAYTFPAPGSVTYTVPLPAGRLLLSLNLTDKLQRTPAFTVAIEAGGNLVFDGAFTFNQAPGTSVNTQSFEVDSPGGNVDIVITWRGGEGQLTLNSLTFEVPLPAETQLTFTVSLQLGAGQPTKAIYMSGVPERPDVIWFDTLVSEPLVAPTLGVTWSAGNGTVLYIQGYDLRVFDLLVALPNALAYDPHKSSLASRALNCARQAYQIELARGFTDPRTLVEGVYTWNEASYAEWIRIITQSEVRLPKAFQIAGPGDIGRAALLPQGVVLEDEVILATEAPNRAFPIFQVLQPWMLALHPRVAGPDFFPPAVAGCASDGDLTALSVAANFTWAVSSPCIPDPAVAYIGAMEATSHLTGAPDGNSFMAYTLPNTGPGGGTVEQTVDLLITLLYTQVSLGYSVVVALIVEPAGGGTPTDDSIVVSFVATGTTTVIAIPTITAPSGMQVSVQSANLV